MRMDPQDFRAVHCVIHQPDRRQLQVRPQFMLPLQELLVLVFLPLLGLPQELLSTRFPELLPWELRATFQGAQCRS